MHVVGSGLDSSCAYSPELDRVLQFVMMRSTIQSEARGKRQHMQTREIQDQEPRGVGAMTPYDDGT